MGKGKYTLRSIIVRCVVIMVGVFITAYGAEAFVLANLGSDPVTAFAQGLSKVLPFAWRLWHGHERIQRPLLRRHPDAGMPEGHRCCHGGPVHFTLGTFCSMMGAPWIIALIGPALYGHPRHSGHHRHAGLGVGLGSYQAAGYGAGS